MSGYHKTVGVGRDIEPPEVAKIRLSSTHGCSVQRRKRTCCSRGRAYWVIIFCRRTTRTCEVNPWVAEMMITNLEKPLKRWSSRQK